MNAYVKTTRAMSAALAEHGAQMTDLAGGCWGVLIPADGVSVILSRSPDLGACAAYATWMFSLEDAEGERVRDVPGLDVDGEYGDLGFIRPRDYGGTFARILQAMAGAR